MSDAAEDGQLKKADPPVSTWRCIVASMFVGIILFICFVIYRGFSPAKWEFSIEAATEVVELELPPNTETRWRIDFAVICARRDALQLSDEFRLDVANKTCGSRAWSAWQVLAPEQVVRLGGDSTATMQLSPDGEFAISLRAADKKSLGTLSVVGVVEDVALGSAVNFLWRQVPVQSLTLPFLGSTTLGRTVSWSGAGMLKSGNVAVYTSDESADKRTLVDNTDLMLGDQVRLDGPEAGLPWPKGFVRVYRGEDAMQVVAFGRAESLRIERFGKSGYDFKPGPVSKLASDPWIAFLGSILAAYMTLVLSLQPFVEPNPETAPPNDVWQRFNSWFRKKPL